MERSRLVDGLARLCERVGDRFLLAATARSAADGPLRGREYAALRASTARLGLLDELTLAPPAPADVAAMLAHWLPGGVPCDELVAEVSRRSGAAADRGRAGPPPRRHRRARAGRRRQAGCRAAGSRRRAAGERAGAARAARGALRSAGRLADTDRDVFDLLASHAAPLPHAALLAAPGRAEPEHVLVEGWYFHAPLGTAPVRTLLGAIVRNPRFALGSILVRAHPEWTERVVIRRFRRRWREDVRPGLEDAARRLGRSVAGDADTGELRERSPPDRCWWRRHGSRCWPARWR